MIQHIEPDAETSPSTTELRNVLLGQAREMLRGILVKERELRARRSLKAASGGKRTKNVVVEVARMEKEEVLDRVSSTRRVSFALVSSPIVSLTFFRRRFSFQSGHRRLSPRPSRSEEHPLDSPHPRIEPLRRPFPPDPSFVRDALERERR
ncbi:hypothetical protein BDY24DRAFT_148684 [Mrakia frigida]|uniref:uncharacterized protein n=1 Tax=Mrakia frigida TaxID=29902 RepID=UPI003FCBF308